MAFGNFQPRSSAPNAIHGSYMKPHASRKGAEVLSLSHFGPPRGLQLKQAFVEGFGRMSIISVRKIPAQLLGLLNGTSTVHRGNKSGLWVLLNEELPKKTSSHRQDANWWSYGVALNTKVLHRRKAPISPTWQGV